MSTIPRQKDFNPEKFSGLWYELSRSKFIPFHKGDFTTWEFTPRADGTIKLTLTTKLKNGNTVINDTLATKLLNAKYSLSGQGWLGGPFPNDINVVQTDYYSFAILVSKPSFAFWRMPYAWILTRNAEVERSYIRHLNYVLQEKGGVSSYIMRETKQIE